MNIEYVKHSEKCSMQIDQVIFFLIHPKLLKSCLYNELRD